MLITAVGHSTDPDPVRAANELWEQVSNPLKPDLPCACLLFCGHPPAFSETLIASLYQHCPDLQLVGCSSFAEASSSLGHYAEHSCTAMFFCSDTVHIATGVVPDVNRAKLAELHAKARSTLASLHTTRPVGKTPKLCLVFTELMHVNQNAIVQALQAELGDQALILGGAAGHATSIDLEIPTCQYLNRDCHHNSAVIMVFSGPLSVSTGVCLNGWYPLYERRMAVEMRPLADGRHLEVTKIDDQPALDFYERAIGTDHLPDPLRDQISICHPLIIYSDDQSNELDYFDVFDKNRAEQSLIITNDVSSPCQIDIATPVWEAVLDDVTASVRRINHEFNGACSTGAIFIACCSRSVAYQVQIDPSDELQAVVSQCKPDLPVIGFYSYIEIGNRSNRPGASRRESMTLVYVLLGEDWDALQADLDRRDPVRLQKILTAVQNERHFKPPARVPPSADKPKRKHISSNTLVSPATSGFAKAELLLIEAGLVLHYLRGLSRQQTGEVYVLSWLSDDDCLIAKRIAEDLLKLAHPRLPKLNTLERHISQAIKQVKKEGKSAQRAYHATLVLGILLLSLEDSGGQVPANWLRANFDPHAIAATLYPKMRSLQLIRYTQSEVFLAGALQEALKGAAAPEYQIDEVYRV